MQVEQGQQNQDKGVGNIAKVCFSYIFFGGFQSAYSSCRNLEG